MKIILDIKPINFFFRLAKLLFIFALIAGVVLIINLNSGRISPIMFLLIFTGLLLIPLAQQVFFGSIYIFFISVSDHLITIKWKHFNKVKQKTVNLNSIKLEVEPFFKRSPRLKVKFKEDQINCIYQIETGKWNERLMQQVIGKINKTAPNTK